MFYVEKQDSQPRVYELTDTVPAPVGPYRRYITKFELTPAFIVHSKMHGTHEKAQPYVVRGVSKNGTLLVQATVATEYDPVGRWHEVECGDTTEGYRFKRYVLKSIATLIKLGQNAAKTRARDAKKQAQQADRDEKCGSCPVCFGDYVVTNRLDSRQFSRYAMVHHGYERPGIGYIVGDCHGVGFEPFEVSCEGTKSWVNQLHGARNYRKEALRQLDLQDEIVVDRRVRRSFRGQVNIERVTIKRGEDGFERAVEARRLELTTTISKIEHDITEYGKKIASWKPQTFPRVVKKAKVS